MDALRDAPQPGSPMFFQVNELDAAGEAFLADPRANVVMISEECTLDLAAVVRADNFARRALASLNATGAHKRMDVRTAILRARPEKGRAKP